MRSIGLQHKSPARGQHGKDVSSVARGNSGKSSDDTVTEAPDITEVKAPEAENEHAGGHTSGNGHRGQSGKGGGKG